MLYLKASSDPLQGISIVNMMIVVSRNQVILPSFIPIMINSEDYKSLKESIQKNLNDMMQEGNTSITFTEENSLNDEEE